MPGRTTLPATSTTIVATEPLVAPLVAPPVEPLVTPPLGDADTEVTGPTDASAPNGPLTGTEVGCEDETHHTVTATATSTSTPTEATLRRFGAHR